MIINMLYMFTNFLFIYIIIIIVIDMSRNIVSCIICMFDFLCKIITTTLLTLLEGTKGVSRNGA